MKVSLRTAGVARRFFCEIQNEKGHIGDSPLIKSTQFTLMTECE